MSREKALQPIAIFDSGMGGLTVARALKKKLPNESLLYLADTASRPFGMKSKQELNEILERNAQLLLSHPIKMLVIACHTACSGHLEVFDKLQVPVMKIFPTSLGILRDYPAIESLLVLGTQRTIDSHIYADFLHQHFSRISSYFIGCSPLEKLIEEKCEDSKVITEEIEHLFLPLQSKNIDAAFLACTHFPIYKNYIKTALGNTSLLIDPAEYFSHKIYEHLKQSHLLNPSSTPSKDQYLITDRPDIFKTKFIYYFGETLAKTSSSFNHPYAML